MIRTASKSTLEFITRALVGSCVLVGIVLAFLTIRTMLDGRTARVLDAESRNLEVQAKKLAEPGQPVASTANPRPRGLEALRILQSVVTQSAANHQCVLSEFKTATQTAPYTPRYKRELPDDPWSQVDAHFTIVGRLRDVMETLQCLNDAPVPVEIDALNLARERITESGSTSITAQVDLRALAQGAPS